jgi:TorA maturation chaperone TorD
MPLEGDDARELRAALTSRAGIYRMLSYLYYRELTDEQIVQLAATDVDALTGDDDLFAQGARQVVRYLRRRDSSTRQTLAADYASAILAAGHYKERCATPYESVFTSEEGLLMQDARDDVYRVFCAEHVKEPTGGHVPDDHLSFTLEFMARLCEQTADAFEIGDGAEVARLVGLQRTFCAEHLANWIDDYCDVLDGCAQTPFYQGVSKMTRGFVHMETRTIEQIAGLLDAA